MDGYRKAAKRTDVFIDHLPQEMAIKPVTGERPMKLARIAGSDKSETLIGDIETSTASPPEKSDAGKQ